MKNRKTKINLFTSIAVVIVLLLVLVLFVIMPLTTRIQNSRNDLAQSQDRLVLLTDRVQNYQEALSELSQVRDGIDRVNKIFPSKIEMVSLIEGLESAISQSGLQSSLEIVEETQVAPTTKPGKQAEVLPPVVSGLDGIKEIEYQLTLAGDYSEFVDFLYFLEDQPFITEIKSFNLKADQLQSEVANRLQNTGQGTMQVNGVFFISSETKQK